MVALFAYYTEADLFRENSLLETFVVLLSGKNRGGGGGCDLSEVEGLEFASVL
jgi:hypothetical protein